MTYDATVPQLTLFVMVLHLAVVGGRVWLVIEMAVGLLQPVDWRHSLLSDYDVVLM